MVRPFLTLALALGAATTLSACVTAAKMHMPNFATPVEKITVKGLGGWTSGQYRAGPYAGVFTRDDERLGLMDPYFVSKRGGSSFSLAGPDIPGTVRGECAWIENTVNVNSISVDVSPLIYRCRFGVDGRPLNADFILRNHRDSIGSMMSVRERLGEVMLDGVRLTVRSTNRIAGTGLPSETPIGYIIEYQGRPIGAVDLNGTNKDLFVPVDAPREVRQAALFAGMALSVFWDPAASMLND